MAEDGEERFGTNFTFAKDRRSESKLIKSADYAIGFAAWFARIMNCLGGVVERDARPPILLLASFYFYPFTFLLFYPFTPLLFYSFTFLLFIA